MKITDTSIRHHTTVFALMLLILFSGVRSYRELPRESYPDITLTQLIITTAYFGVAPSDIESLVTRKLETKINELSDVKEIYSTSAEGLSTIVVEFDLDTDVDSAYQKVREKVDLAKAEIPDDVEEPVITEINFSEFPIMIVNISGDLSLVALKDVAERLEDEIETIQGILNVDISGGLEREVKVNVDPVRLKQFGLGLQDVVDAVRNENLTMPGGTIDVGQYEVLIRVPGEFERPGPIQDVVLSSDNGRTVYMRDVAQVEYGFKERTSIARFNGRPTVSLSIQKRSGENLVQIADEIKERLDAAGDWIPRGVELTIVGDQSKDIRKMIRELENNMVSGLVLVVLVMFLFMGFRSSFFVASAIPLSMLISFVVLRVMDYTLNMVVLFSLILSLGMLVDNAIVIVENIYRHQQEGLGRLRSASVATDEVAWPVISSTATTLCAFIPLLFWPDIIGEFMHFLPATVIITLSASLFVAMVINPVLCSRFLHVKAGTGPSYLDSWVLRWYKSILEFCVSHRWIPLVGILVLFAVTIQLYGVFNHGVELFPRVEPNKLAIDIRAPSGTRLETSDEYVRAVERKGMTEEDILHYVSSVGSTPDMFSQGSETANASRVTVDFKDREDRTQSSWITMEAIRRKIAGFTGVEIRLNEEEHGPPTGPPVNIEISGEDFATLGALSKQVEEKIKGIGGLVNLESDFDQGRPEVIVSIDREQAGLAGVTTFDIASQIRTAIHGTEASKYRVGEDEYDITVRLARSSRSRIEDLEKLHISVEGRQIPLVRVARLEFAGGLSAINRRDLKRVVTVSAEVAGRNENEARIEAENLVETIELPPGYRIEFTGENEEQQKASAFLTEAYLIALFLIGIILITQFNSVIHPFIILFSVMLSFIGVLGGLMILGKPFGIIMTGVGVISLAGVVVNNSIVLLDYTNKLRSQGLSRTEATIRAGLIRFRPVMFTAVTTIFGVIPLTFGINFDFRTGALELGGESSQWWGPMGAAVIFGLGVATVLTLIIVPVMYHLLDSAADRVNSFLHRLGFGVPPDDELSS